LIDDAALLAHLTELEMALMRNAGPGGAAQAAALLHPQVEEVGRSGRRYDRGALLRLLAESNPAGQAGVQASGFSLHLLGLDIALLRYRSERVSGATEPSSIWQRDEGGWRLRFHQGTPA
jgi:ribonuclease HI